MGGDYDDIFLTPTGSLCLVIADVSGKGIPAALVMAGLRAALHRTSPNQSRRKRRKHLPSWLLNKPVSRSGHWHRRT